MSEQARKTSRRPFLHLVVRTAGIAAGTGGPVTAAQERNREAGVIATPAVTA